jgi:hypothetical protein
MAETPETNKPELPRRVERVLVGQFGTRLIQQTLKRNALPAEAAL